MLYPSDHGGRALLPCLGSCLFYEYGDGRPWQMWMAVLASVGGFKEVILSTEVEESIFFFVVWSASSADGMHLEAWQMQLSGYFSLIFLDSFSLLLPGIYGILPCIFSSSCQAPCILFILLLLGEYLLLQHWSPMLYQFCSVMKLLSLLRGYFFLLPHSFALV